MLPADQMRARVFFLPADFTADRAFLLIHGALFRAGDVSVVESSHRSFLTADGAIFQCNWRAWFPEISPPGPPD